VRGLKALLDPDLERGVNINVVRRDPATGDLTRVLVHPWSLPRTGRAACGAAASGTG
jgi:hypothetical protein